MLLNRSKDNAYSYNGKWRQSKVESSLLLLIRRHIFRWVSLALEHLSSLNLFLHHDFLSGLCVFLLLLEVLPSGLGRLYFLVLLGLNCSEHLLSVGLGLLDSVFGDLFFFHLDLVHLLEYLSLDGVLSFLAALSCFLKFDSLFLRLLHDDVDKLRSFLDGDFHLDIEGRPDLGRLRVDEV